jgi:hypothetical protein
MERAKRTQWHTYGKGTNDFASAQHAYIMVNTFLVDPSFSRSAFCLDAKRLGKQRVEAKQILKAILILHQLCNLLDDYTTDDLSADIRRWRTKYKQGDNKLFLDEDWNVVEGTEGKEIPLGFTNHPAVRMWFFSPEALTEYLNAHIAEWIARGYNNTMPFLDTPCAKEDITYPAWMAEPSVYTAYCATLRNKDPEYYCFLPMGELSSKWPEDSPDKRLTQLPVSRCSPITLHRSSAIGCCSDALTVEQEGQSVNLACIKQVEQKNLPYCEGCRSLRFEQGSRASTCGKVIHGKDVFLLCSNTQ